ncbi:retinal short-chain dehydrogenase/reductase [Coprinellus micaceus]|uniref:Short-chain dehydrogenase/reductase 3 n=1 Tax=Coprinellus micaceus TaxID=71717 RepID=A0A4Y7TNG4_COPMI|nr:retinal short-chain dehydrogenase/reductase [Coprinellus micaceus]
MPPSVPDGSPIFDSLDVDLFVKVLSHTLFSPFFVFFIPIFFIFQGAKVTDTSVVGFGVYYVVISLFWFTRWASRLWRNQGSFLFGPPKLDWGDEIVLITGGASGVGELLANTLAVRNVTVVVLDVNPIVTENYNITYYKCDVSKWEEVSAVADRIQEEIGDPTIIINNAGVAQGKLILDLTPDDIEQTFGVNTLAHFWTLKAFLPAIIKRKEGHVMTMSSVLGITAAAQMTDYCASKAALIALNQSLRYELDHRYNTPKIRTTILLPGHIQTPLFQTAEFNTAFWFKFLAPSLPPVTVVKRIIAALDEQHSQTIYLPFYTYTAPLVNVMPSFVRDFSQWLTGADFVLRNFVKVSGRRVPEGPAPVSTDKED